MIDARPSLAAAEAISGRNLAEYMRQHGWIVTPSRFKGTCIATLPFADAGAPSDLWVLVPIVYPHPEEIDLLAAALRTLAALERRPEAEVARDIAAITDRDGAVAAAE